MRDDHTIGQTVCGFIGLVGGILLFLWFLPVWFDSYRDRFFPSEHGFFWFVLFIIISISALFLSVSALTVMAICVKLLLRYLVSLIKKLGGPHAR